MTETTDRAALIAEAAEAGEYPTDSAWCGNLIKDLAAALADAERELAKAWKGGWLTGSAYGYWVERGQEDKDIQDLALAANPYGPDA